VPKRKELCLDGGGALMRGCRHSSGQISDRHRDEKH
jgi:hypothetical protein